jgi:hypothetical protein
MFVDKAKRASRSGALERLLAFLPNIRLGLKGMAKFIFSISTWSDLDK